MDFADSHIHFTEIRDGNAYSDLNDSKLLFSCVAKRCEWNVQKTSTAVRFYGIHPWYAADWNDSARTELVSILSDDPEAHIGEIGLDNKHGDPDTQTAAFSDQVAVASDMNRTVNVHNIGCDGDIVRMLKKDGRHIRSAVMHAFKGPDVKPYSGIDCYFSINPRILGKSEDSLRDILSKIPRDRLLVESDAPYTARGFTSMGDFISTLSSILDMDAEELASVTLDNARRAIE